MNKHFLVSVLAIAVAGCGSEGHEQSTDLLAPVALTEHIAFVSTDPGEAYLLHAGVANPEPTTERHAIAKNAILSERRKPEQNELLVLSLGDLDPDEGAPVSPALSAVTPKGVDRIYELSAGFDRLIQSEDGRYAAVLFAEGGHAAQRSLLFNENEMALLDLSQPPGDSNPAHRTLKGEGQRLKNIVFSPEMEIDGETRRLAVVMFESMISLIDLNHPTRSEVTVPLTDAGEGQVDVEQVRFDVEENKLYLRGNASADIYVVQLTETPNTVNAFTPTLNQLGKGTAVHDMGLYGSDAERRLLVAAGNQALVIEADTNTVTSVTLEASATSLLLFEGAAPFNSDVEPRALLYTPREHSITFLDLVGVEERTSRNAERLRLPQPVDSLLNLEDNIVAALHAGGGVSLVDLEQRTVTPVSSNSDLSNAVLDPTQSRLWLAPRNEKRVGYLDLEGYQTGEVRLDNSTAHAFPLMQAAHPRFAVVHHSSIGHVTLLDAANPRNIQLATSLQGFLVSDRLSD